MLAYFKIMILVLLLCSFFIQTKGEKICNAKTLVSLLKQCTSKYQHVVGHNSHQHCNAWNKLSECITEMGKDCSNPYNLQIKDQADYCENNNNGIKENKQETKFGVCKGDKMAEVLAPCYERILIKGLKTMIAVFVDRSRIVSTCRLYSRMKNCLKIKGKKYCRIAEQDMPFIENEAKNILDISNIDISQCHSPEKFINRKKDIKIIQQ